MDTAAGGGVCPRCALAGIFESAAAMSGEGSPTPPTLAHAPRLPAEAAGAAPDRHLGRYVLTKKLGAGGMGEVWKAWDTGMERWVALKFVKGADAEDVERLRREARLAGTLAHPNLAAVYETGEAGGRPFIAMQLIAGRTMRGWPRGDAREAARLLRDAARAVSYAHDRGIVHRDLKPDNLMVDAAQGSGHLYVMDFGLARPVSGTRISQTGTAVGTPAYMSPEQAEGRAVDARSDVYGLGATLYELLTGRAPFEGANALEILGKVHQQDPVPPRRLAPELDADLETIVLKCLEKPRERRYATAGELADDLDRFIRGESILARPGSLLYRAGKVVRRHRAAFGVALAAALIGGLAAAWRPASEAAARHMRRRESSRLLEDAARRLAAGDCAGARAGAEELVRRFERHPGEGHPLARAGVVAARASRALGEERAARAGAARAWQDGAGAADPGEREAAAAAMLVIGELWEARNPPDFLHARAAWRTFESRFPALPAAAEASWRAARCSVELGDLEDALGRYAALLGGGSPAAERRAEAQAAVAVLADVAGVREFVMPEGELRVAVLEAGRPGRVVALDPNGRLSVVELAPGGARVLDTGHRAPGKPDAVFPLLWTLDADGDGVEEVATSWTPPTDKDRYGGVHFWRFRGGRLEAGRALDLGAPAKLCRALDLDGDGAREMLVFTAGERTLRVFRWPPPEGAAPELLFERRGADVQDLVRVGGGTGASVVISRGPPDGWRLLRSRWDASTRDFPEQASLPEPAFVPSVFEAGDGRLVFGCTWPGTCLLDSRAEASGRPEPLRAGFYEVALSGSGGFERRRTLFEAAQENAFDRCAPVRVAGRPHLVWSSRAAPATGVRLLPLDSPSLPARPMPLTFEAELLVGVADVDGDGKDEVLTRRGGPGEVRLRVYGWGPAAAPRARETRPPGSAGGDEGSGRDLIAVGLFEEAAETYAGTGDWMGVGLACAELEAVRRREGALDAQAGRHEDARAARRDAMAFAVRAVAAFGKVAGAERWRALRRRAACLSRLRAWAELRATLAELRERADLDPEERDAVERELQAAAAAAALEKRDDLPGLADAVAPVPGNPHAGALRVENPLLVRADGPDLDFRIPLGVRTHAGLPFSFSGGPFRLRWELRVSPHVRGNPACVGVHGPADLGIVFAASGTGPALNQTQALFWRDADGRSAETPLPANAFRPGEEWFEAELEYVPSPPRARVMLRRGEEEAELDLALTAPLPPGAWMFGTIGDPEWSERPQEETVVRLRRVTFESAAAADRFDAAAGATPRDRLFAANGAFTLGRLEDAVRGYDAIVADAGARDPWPRWCALFFRTLALQRLGRAAEAAEALDVLLRSVPPAELRRLLHASWPGLTDGERSGEESFAGRVEAAARR